MFVLHDFIFPGWMCLWNLDLVPGYIVRDAIPYAPVSLEFFPHILLILVNKIQRGFYISIEWAKLLMSLGYKDKMSI